MASARSRPSSGSIPIGEPTSRIQRTPAAVPISPLCSAAASRASGGSLNRSIQFAPPGPVTWLWQSTMPGTNVAPALSITVAPLASSSPPVGRIQAIRPSSTRMLTLRWSVADRPSASAPSRYRTRPVTGAGVGLAVGCEVGDGAGGSVAGGVTLAEGLGVSVGMGVAQAASPTADAAAPSWSSFRRLIGAGCACIGPLSAERCRVGDDHSHLNRRTAITNVMTAHTPMPSSCGPRSARPAPSFITPRSASLT